MTALKAKIRIFIFAGALMTRDFVSLRLTAAIFAGRHDGSKYITLLAASSMRVAYYRARMTAEAMASCQIPRAQAVCCPPRAAAALRRRQ